MVKYGLESFTFEVIEQVNDNILNDREMFWIGEYNSIVPHGYNMTAGGDGTVGYSRKQSKAEKQQRSLSGIEYYQLHPEAKERMSERAKQLWQDEEYRKRVTESNKKYYQEHPGIHTGKNNPMYGKKHTPEALEKIRTHAATCKCPIAQLDKDTLEVIRIFDGVRDAENELKVSHGWLSKAAKQGKVAYGYRWQFIQKV